MFVRLIFSFSQSEFPVTKHWKFKRGLQRDSFSNSPIQTQERPHEHILKLWMDTCVFVCTQVSRVIYPRHHLMHCFMLACTKLNLGKKRDICIIKNNVAPPTKLFVIVSSRESRCDGYSYTFRAWVIWWILCALNRHLYVPFTRWYNRKQQHLWSTRTIMRVHSDWEEWKRLSG